MDANELHNLTECPNCGANLPPAGPDGMRRCQYCESVFRASAPPAPPQPPPAMTAPPNMGGWSASSSTFTVDPSTTTYVGAQKAAKGCSAVGCFFTIAILAVVGVAVFFAFRGSIPFSSLLADKPDGSATFAPPAANGSTTVYSMVRKLISGNTTYAIVRLDSPNSSPVWTSPDLPGTSAGQAPIITDGTHVFVAVDSTVRAFRADNGTLAWQGTLSDAFTTSCKDCFFLAGNRLVVESKDSTYQAFDTATGTPAWTRKAVDVSAYAAPFGDQTMLLDDDADHDGLIYLIGADGTETAKIRPTCDARGSSTPEEFDDGAVVVPLPLENAAVFGYGSPYPCWQRIDFTTGQVAWSTPITDSSFSSVSRTSTFIVSQGARAAIVDDKTIASLDLATGELKKVAELPDTDLYPLALRENTLIVQTANTRGTKKYGIHAVDLTTGQEGWGLDLGKAEPSEGPGSSTIFLSTGDARFTTHLDGDQFHVVTFDHDSRQLQLTNVTVSTGQKTTGTVDSGVSDSLPHFEAQGWQGPNVLLGFDSNLLILNTATSTISFHYP